MGGHFCLLSNKIGTIRPPDPGVIRDLRWKGEFTPSRGDRVKLRYVASFCSYIYIFFIRG